MLKTPMTSTEMLGCLIGTGLNQQVWEASERGSVCPGRHCSFWSLSWLPVSRATAQTARCLPPQSPAPPAADGRPHKPRLALGLTSPTRRSCAARSPRWRATKTSKAARRPRGGPSPPGRTRRLSWVKRRATSSGSHPHRAATPRSRSWPPRTTTTAQTPLVPWRPWPLRRPWPAAWDAPTPSAPPAHVCELAGRSPTDISGNVWRRRCQWQAAILWATQRRTTGARGSSCRRKTGRRTEATLFSKVLWGPETSGSLVEKKKEKRCEPKIKRTIISGTVVASWHGTLTINKVYFLTRTWV